MPSRDKTPLAWLFDLKNANTRYAERVLVLKQESTKYMLQIQFWLIFLHHSPEPTLSLYSEHIQIPMKRLVACPLSSQPRGVVPTSSEPA